jgi:hypothetical protein
MSFKNSSKVTVYWFEILFEIRLVIGLVVLGLIGVMAARSSTMGSTMY